MKKFTEHWGGFITLNPQFKGTCIHPNFHSTFTYFVLNYSEPILAHPFRLDNKTKSWFIITLALSGAERKTGKDFSFPKN